MVKVSNENEVAAYHVIRIFLAVIFIAYLTSIWAFPEYFPWSGNKVIQVVGHTYAVIYLLATLYLALRGGMWFVEFILKDEIYEFRYYLLTTPFGTRKMARIPANNLYAFKIHKNFIKKTLILYQEKDGKVFQYPPIPIGSLLKEKQQLVIDTLKIYAVELT
jgi:hypothetical protein